MRVGIDELAEVWKSVRLLSRRFMYWPLGTSSCFGREKVVGVSVRLFATIKESSSWEGGRGGGRNTRCFFAWID